MKKPDKDLSKIRERQRAHAKQRFQERFNLTLNRHQIREVERKIATGQVALAGKKTGKLRNYLLTVEDRLIAVGYNRGTKRIVTALPNSYLESLPAETVLWARLRLIPAEASHIVTLIETGKARLLYRRRGRSFYEVLYRDELIRIGYNEAKRKLVPYRDEPIGPLPS